MSTPYVEDETMMSEFTGYGVELRIEAARAMK